MSLLSITERTVFLLKLIKLCLTTELQPLIFVPINPLHYYYYYYYYF
jgi:hypothetical protein